MGGRHYASLKPDAVPTILFAHKAEEVVLAEKDEPLREDSDGVFNLDNDDQSESSENFREVTPWESKIEKEFKARKKSLVSTVLYFLLHFNWVFAHSVS